MAGGVNLYAYAGGNPVSFADPFGLCDVKKDPVCALINAVGGMLAPMQRPLEIGGTLAMLPLSGGMGMTGAAVGWASRGSTTAVAGSGAASTSAGVADRVIGHHPQYLQVAEAIGAKYFNIPSAQWNAMSESARWAANKGFLDQGIKEGAEFVLATRRTDIRSGSILAREVKYLLEQGYQWAADKLSLVPR